MTPTELAPDSNSKASEEKPEEPERWTRGEQGRCYWLLSVAMIDRGRKEPAFVSDIFHIS